jgi:hypothetical protein
MPFDAELGLHRDLDVDLGEDAEPLVLSASATSATPFAKACGCKTQ